MILTISSLWFYSLHNEISLPWWLVTLCLDHSFGIYHAISEDVSLCALYSTCMAVILKACSISCITLRSRWHRVQCLARWYCGSERTVLPRTGRVPTVHIVDRWFFVVRGHPVPWGCLAAVWPLTARYPCILPQGVTTKTFSWHGQISWRWGTNILVENYCSKDWEM